MTRRAALVLAAASVVFLWFAVRQAWTDAPTYDEPTYLISGLTGWTRHDLRINRQHPPLAKQVASVPVLLLHPTIPRDRGWRTGNEHRLAASFVRAEIERGRLRRVFFVARLVPVLEGLAAGWVIALLAARLFGPEATVLPGLLWLLNPFTIGLSHVDGIDVPFTLTVLVTALATAWARERTSARRCAVVGLCAGASVLTRLTGVFVVPLAAAAVMMTPSVGPRLRHGLVVVGTSWLTLAVTYFALAPTAAVSGVLGTIVNLAVPVDWWRGATYLLHVGSRPGPAFVEGRFHVGQWLFFWPASLVVKLPPLTLLVLVAAPFALIRVGRQARREAFWVIGLPAIVLTAFTLQQERPIGLRYLLASIALAMVGAGAVAVALRGCTRQVLIATTAVGGLLAAAALPSLAWTSPLAGRSDAAAADSNLDWGQGFYALQSWAKGRDPWIAYFGGAGLDVREIPGARPLGSGPPPATSGWVAVSVSDLVDYRRDDLAWLRARCPVTMIDQTILVYELERATVGSCGHVSGSPVVTRRNTRVTPRSSTSRNAGSVSVHIASTGSR